MLRFIYNMLLRIFLKDIDLLNYYILSPSFFVLKIFLSFLSPKTWLSPLFHMLSLITSTIISQDSLKSADKFIVATFESLIYNEEDLSALNLHRNLLELLSSDTLIELNTFSFIVWVYNSNIFPSLYEQLILSQEEHCFKMFLLENYPGKYFDIYPNCPVIEQVIQEFFAREFPEHTFKDTQVKPLVTNNSFFVNRAIYDQAFEDTILGILEDLKYEDFYYKYIKGHEVLITFIVIQSIRMFFY